MDSLFDIRSSLLSTFIVGASAAFGVGAGSGSISISFILPCSPDIRSSIDSIAILILSSFLLAMLGIFFFPGRSNASTVLIDLGVSTIEYGGKLVVLTGFGGDGDGFAFAGNIYETTLLLADLLEGVLSATLLC